MTLSHWIGLRTGLQSGLQTGLRAASLAALSVMAACGSTAGPELRASSPLIYVASTRSSADVASCLEDRLPSPSTSTVGNVSELRVGSDAWLVTLTPTARGSTVKVQKSDRDGGLSEPEMRFDIARCSV